MTAGSRRVEAVLRQYAPTVVGQDELGETRRGGLRADQDRHAVRGPDGERGATTSHVRIDIGSGAIVTASITNEAVDELGLKVGDSAAAVIKASDVIVGKL
jgi:molybdopterin-binding protein